MISSSKVLHIAKGDTGGLDVAVSNLANSRDEEVLLLHGCDKGNLYNRKTIISSYSLGPEIILPRGRSVKTFVKAIVSNKIIHVHITNLVIFFMWPLFLNRRVVFSIHKNFGLEYTALYKGFVKRTLFTIVRTIALCLFLNYINLFASKIILLTHVQRKDFHGFILNKKRFLKNSEVIYNSVPEPMILDTKKTISIVPRIIYIGRLSKFKGAADLAKIVNDPRTKDFNFTVIGEGEYSIFFSNVPNVQYFASVRNKEITHYIDEADILILPSYSETFGLVILEGMARGLCVLASALPPIKEFFKDSKNGYLYEAGDIDGFVTRLEYLKSNRSELDRISTFNRIDIHKYTEGEALKKYALIYG